MAKVHARRGPNLLTIQKLRELVKYRERYRKQMDKLPTLTSSCHQIGISHKTVKRHATELAEKWNDKDFHW